MMLTKAYQGLIFWIYTKIGGILELHCHNQLTEWQQLWLAILCMVLLGGAGGDNLFSNQVFSVQLDDFISQAVTRKSELASPWQNLPDTLVTSCTALAFNGALLAIGGNKPGDWRAKHIHLFKPSTRTCMGFCWTIASQPMEMCVHSSSDWWNIHSWWSWRNWWSC